MKVVWQYAPLQSPDRALASFTTQRQWLLLCFTSAHFQKYGGSLGPSFHKFRSITVDGWTPRGGGLTLARCWGTYSATGADTFLHT